MFKLFEPTHEAIERFRDEQSRQPLTYSSVGATRTLPDVLPPECSQGYRVDHNRVLLGHGAAVFELAGEALSAWRMFDIGWVRIASPRPPIELGTVVAILARPLGIWSLNASKIVYLVDDDGPTCRFGFAYGTLVEHVESGEERFTVEWNRDDDSVWYDLLAFSRPQHPLARVGHRYARSLQRRFVAGSLSAMARACRTE